MLEHKINKNFQTLYFTTINLLVLIAFFYFNWHFSFYIFFFIFLFFQFYYLKISFFWMLFFLGLLFFLILGLHWFVYKFGHHFNNQFYVVSETNNKYFIRYSFDKYFYLNKIKNFTNKNLQSGAILNIQIDSINYFSYQNYFIFSFNNYLFSNNIKGEILKYSITEIIPPNSLKIWWNNLEKKFLNLNLSKTLIFNCHIFSNKFYKFSILMNVVQLIIIGSKHLEIFKKFYFSIFIEKFSQFQ